MLLLCGVFTFFYVRDFLPLPHCQYGTVPWDVHVRLCIQSVIDIKDCSFSFSPHVLERVCLPNRVDSKSHIFLAVRRCWHRQHLQWSSYPCCKRGQEDHRYLRLWVCIWACYCRYGSVWWFERNKSCLNTAARDILGENTKVDFYSMMSHPIR